VLATDKIGWLYVLKALRDPTLRKAVGQKARTTALASYSIQKQAGSMITVLRGLMT